MDLDYRIQAKDSKITCGVGNCGHTVGITIGRNQPIFELISPDSFVRNQRNLEKKTGFAVF